MQHITDYVDNHKHEICLCHFPIAEYNGYYKGHYHQGESLLILRYLVSNNLVRIIGLQFCS